MASLVDSKEKTLSITGRMAPDSIRAVIDKVFSFESTNEALAYVESGRAKGKVVIKVR